MFCIGVMCFGVYAAQSVNVQISGTITFEGMPIRLNSVTLKNLILDDGSIGEKVLDEYSGGQDMTSDTTIQITEEIVVPTDETFQIVLNLTSTASSHIKVSATYGELPSGVTVDAEPIFLPPKSQNEEGIGQDFVISISNTNATEVNLGSEQSGINLKVICERVSSSEVVSYNKVLISNPLKLMDFAGKKITILGDSITYGVGSTGSNNGYAKLLGDILDATIENKGVSGTTFCEGAEQKDGSPAYSQINNLRSYNGTTDYFIVALGANDWTLSNNGDGIKLGTLGSTDTTTIYGAVNVYCQILTEKFKDTNTKIYFSTPTISRSVVNFSSTITNNWGYTLRDICKAITETAKTYDIPTFDMNLHSGIYYNSASDNNVSETMQDGVHPNDAGHTLMANALADFLLENYSYEREGNVRTLTLQIDDRTVTKKFLVNSSYKLPAPSIDNKTFLRWVDSKGIIYNAGESITLSSNMSLTAVFSSDMQTTEYRVSVINSYGGIFDDTNDKVVFYSEDGLITQESLNLSDSLGLVPSFYKDSNLSQQFDFNTDTIKEGLTEIYVNWETTTDWFTTEYSSITGFSETFNSLSSTDLDKITKLVLPSKGTSGTALSVLNGGQSMTLYFSNKLLHNLEKIIFPEGYTTISGTFTLSYGAYEKAITFNSQATIYIPSTMTTIAETSFANINAKKFIIAEGNTTFSTDETGSILFNYNKTRLIKMLTGSEITSYTVPEGVTEIGDRAFMTCAGLISLTINSDIPLTDYSVYRCSNLITFTYMGDISKINRQLFKSIESANLNAIYVKDETEKTDLINLLKYGTLTPDEETVEMSDSITTYANIVQVKQSA